MRNVLIGSIFSFAAMVAAADNLLTNPSFEHWQDGRPVGWTTIDGTYEPDYVNKIDGAVAVRTKVDVNQKVPPGYLNSGVSQTVRLKPQTPYRLSVFMAKDATGVYRITVNPGPVANPGKEILLLTQWVWGFPYTCFKGEFTTTGGTEYTIHLRQYGNASAWAYFDAASLEELRRGDDAPATPKTAALFEQSVMWPVAADRLGPEAQPLEALNLTLTRGETEARTVLLHPGEAALPRVVLRPAGNLAAPGGSTIPATAVTVRSVRNGVLLPLAQPEDVAAGRLTAWQVFVQTTPETPPGRYTGQVTVESDGQAVRTVPLTVEVVDLVLPPARINFGIYHSMGYFPEAFINETYAAKVYRDMAAHGMNTLTVYNNPEAAEGQYDLAHDYGYDAALIPEKHRDWKAQDDPAERYKPSRWAKLFALGLDKIMPLALEAGLLAKEHPVLWLPVKPGLYTFGGMPPATLEKALAEWHRRGWPEPLLYVCDEPSLPEREAEAFGIFRRLEEAGLRGRVRTVTARPDPGRPLAEKYDVWILGANSVNYRSHEQAVRQNKGFWMYDCAVPNNNAAFARAQYGFAAYAANLGGVWQWGYYDAGDKFVVTADGRVDAKPQLARVALGPDGPVPTVAWEATREGTEDYRLVQCFDDLFAAASQISRDKLANVRKTLADSDCGLIRKREEQKYGKQPPAPPVVEWTANTEAKKAAEKEFLDVLERERILFTAGLVKSLLVDSVPFALAGSGRIPSEAWRAGYDPDLAETEQVTGAEIKRAVLLPHVLRLQEVVRRYGKAGE